MPADGRALLPDCGPKAADGLPPNHVASVVISKIGRPAGLRYGCECVTHAGDRAVERFRDRNPVFCRQLAREPEEIKSVDVVVDGLLKMESIGTNLSLSLLQQDFPAEYLPARRIRNLRTRRANGEERYAFAQQMGIRREICGQKALNIPAVEVESGQ